MASAPSVGIAAIGTYIPGAVITSRELAERSGFPEYVFSEKIGLRQKPVAGPHEHPSEMAAQAARDALRRAQVRPEDLDLVLYCGTGLYDYAVWSPAAKVQHLIGAVNAFAYEVRNGCNGSTLGLYLASRHLLADSDHELALVICSDTMSRLADYTDESQLSMFTQGDGATAALLQKNHPGNSILSHAGVSDGSLADEVYVPLGGTRIPWSSDQGSVKLGYWRIADPDRLADVFADLYVQNYVKVVREALRKSARSVGEIDFLFTNQVKLSTHRAILDTLGLPEERTCRTMESFGHMASSDTLIGLAQTLETGRIREGSLVVLASSGIGFHWAATVVQY